MSNNTFLDNMQDTFNYDLTQNGGITHTTTQSAVYDMFALGGAYRSRPDEDCILLFKNAYEEDHSLALKCLFYLRDCRGGQGERRFFRVCFRWLANEDPQAGSRVLIHLSEYGRWDDLVYCCIDTPLQEQALDIIKEQLQLDLTSSTPSLLAKWLPSENSSSEVTKRAGGIVRTHLGLSHKTYRKVLSLLRERINIVERLMSENRWDEIEFDKLPSRAGMIYKNAFARRDIIAKKYEAFSKDKDAKVNASVLYPYEIVSKAIQEDGWVYKKRSLSETDRLMLEKYWNNLPNYLEGNECKMLCVVDTSGSMTWKPGPSAPINVAIGLGMYCAERVGGPFKDCYISFSSRPQLIKIEGVDFVDKVQRIYDTNLCENTDLVKTFEVIRGIALQSKPEDIPTDIVIISDMEIDSGCGYCYKYTDPTERYAPLLTEMEAEKQNWIQSGLKMPRLTYWNVDARHNHILDLSSEVSYVSGFSPIVFKQVLTGKTGYELMMETLNSDRYTPIF